MSSPIYVEVQTVQDVFQTNLQSLVVSFTFYVVCHSKYMAPDKTSAACY